MIQRANIDVAQLAYLQSTSSEIANCRSDVWAAVSCFRRGTNAKNAFTKATPALVDTFGARIETAEGIKLRWIEHFASIEAGDVVPVDYVVDAVLAAEARNPTSSSMECLRICPGAPACSKPSGSLSLMLPLGPI